MKRIIKDIRNYSDNKDIIELKPNTKILHPITSNFINTSNSDNELCLTKYYYKDNLNILKENKCNNYDKNLYKTYLYTPPIGLSYIDLLNIYNINNIDDLTDWVNNNLDNDLSYLTINRILNSWIYYNLNVLKKYNKILIDIYFKIIIKINFEFNYKENIKENINYYINYWINKYNEKLYNFNLLEYLLLYLEKKYKL
jgi:hypothetical protein